MFNTVSTLAAVSFTCLDGSHDKRVVLQVAKDEFLFAADDGSETRLLHSAVSWNAY